MRKEKLVRGLQIASEILLWLGLAVAPTQAAVQVREETYVALADPLIWGAAGLLALAVLMTRQWRRFIPPLWGGVGFVLWAVFSAAWVIKYPEFRTVTPMWALKDIIQYVEYLVLLPFLLKFVFERNRRQVAFLILMACQLAVIGFYAFVQLRSGNPFDCVAWFGSRNVLGGYLSLMLPLAVGLLLCSGIWQTLFLLLPVLLFGFYIDSAGGSVLAITVSLLTIGFAKGWRFFLIVAAGLLLWHQPFRVTRELDLRYADVDSIMPYDWAGDAARRYPEWQAAVQVSYEFPWVGVGPGQYQENIGQFYGSLPDPTGPNEPDIQNLYAVILASMGIPAVILFLTILLDGVRGAMRGFVASDDKLRKGIALGVMGSLIAFAINCIWSPLLVRGIGLHFISIVMLGVTCRQAKLGASEPSGTE